jgi:branched-chain amino acid transport system permease protein
MGLPVLGLLVIATLVAVIYCAAYGYTMEKLAYKPLRGAQRLSPLISAIGVSIFLLNYVQLAQTAQYVIFPLSVPDFPFLEPVAHIFDSASFLLLATSILIMAGLTLFIKHTRLGKAMRATAQNRKMAMLLGIDADKIISATFIIGSGLAALGGVLILTRTPQFDFNVGFLAGMKAFTAAVLGGIGSIPGAMLGGIVLGLCESYATMYISSDYENVFAFGILILILIFRPSGLLGKARTEKV